MSMPRPDSRPAGKRLSSSGFGIELSGMDLTHLDRDAEELLQSSFYDSGGLLLLRGQGHIAPGDLSRFAALFGELELNEKYDPEFLLPGHPEILRIGNLKEDGAYRSLFIEADPEPLLWHCDDSFRDPQPIGSCLFCLETPAVGGETYFAGMTAAYERLAPERQRQLSGTKAVHSYQYLNETLRSRNPHRPPLGEALRRQYPPVIRPIVALHPETGKRSLYLPRCHIESVLGLVPERATELLDELLQHATSEELVYRHHWSVGDLVIWDNRSTLHAPSPFDATRHRRLMYRLTVSGPQIGSV